MNKSFTYADNAATTKLDPKAFEAMLPFLLEEYGNASQPYSFSRSSKEALKEARQTIAQLINAEPEEIFFTSGGSESNNWAIKASAFSDIEKRATITSQIEHSSVLESCASIERLGYPVAYLHVDQHGLLAPEALERCITDRTRLVSVMLSNNEIATIQAIDELAEIANRHGALFHTDAVQAVGHMPIDVKKIGVDMLSASAHKFNGPKGVGFLYVRSGVKLLPLIDGGKQEFGHRAGTENIAAVVGMAVALKENISENQKNTQHLLSLEQVLLDGLKAEGVDFVRNGINHLPGNVSLSFKGKDGETLLHRLDLMGIAVSTGAACDSYETQISHVLEAIRLEEEYAKGTIRISFGKYNSLEEAEKIANAIVKILKSTPSP
ncbi:MAG TPA: cysteine desulfurase family protein [Clostridiales bacterium]|nr:cysteine desulfurase family protein [Clostridiales bacterium]